MGNICNNSHLEKQQTTETIDTLNKNYPICQFTLNSLCKVALIQGSYRYHRAETLLLLSQPDYLEYCPELREYAANRSQCLEQAMLDRKKVLSIPTVRSSPYKKLHLYLLAPYSSLDSEPYLQGFLSMLQQLLAVSSDITLQLSYSGDSSNAIPNQTLMGVFVRCLEKWNRAVRITVISGEVRLLNMVRYEIVKGGNWGVTGITGEFKMD